MVIRGDILNEKLKLIIELVIWITILCIVIMLGRNRMRQKIDSMSEGNRSYLIEERFQK